MAVEASPEPWATIQEASRRSGLTEPTLRYYEQIGLIDPVPRDESSGHRRYSAEAVERLEALACLRGAGMGIGDMRVHLELLTEGNAAAEQQQELFERHAARLAAEIDGLRLRLDYLTLKAELWAARAREDEAAEQADIVALTALIAQF